ncbi:hypothetical protein [Pseudoalteromonas sp. XMcav11-Q]|uniref:hypothetical protein n=1 Tax=Pseudoalteromonas sp. XMcav11-Q TaxID=3136665 RepID=UPI0032C3DCE6
MKFINDITKYLGVHKLVRNHVGYYCDSIYSLSDSGFVEAPSTPKVLILARKHFKETWQTYPSVSHNELRSILSLQTELESGLVKFIHKKNDVQEGFDVQTLVIDKELVDYYPHCIYIPETELVGSMKGENERVYELETPIGVLYYSSGGKSSSVYENALVSNIDRFCLSMGISDSKEKVRLNQNDYSGYLVKKIENINLTELINLAVFDSKRIFNWNYVHGLYLVPLFTALLVAVGAKVFTSIELSKLNSEITENSAQIENLLSQSNKVEQLKRYVIQTNNNFSQYPQVHKNWQIAFEAINSGMDIQQFSGEDNNVTIRGFADSASQVLESIARSSMIESAQFSGSVMKSGKRDYFVLELKVKKTNEN